MVRLLLITFAAAFAVFLTCMGAAFALGSFRPIDFDWVNGEGVRWEKEANWQWPPPKTYPPGSIETRDFPWQGGDSLRLVGMVDVDYRQGPETKVTATGAPELLDALRVEDDLIGFTADCFRYSVFVETKNAPRKTSDGHSAGCLQLDPKQQLKITVTAPSVQKFVVSGASKLAIAEYSHDNLELEVSGAAQVTGAGRARRLDLELSGASLASLANLKVDEAEAELSGASHATLTPARLADLEVSGASKATLTVRPADLNQRVTGASLVEQP